MNEKRTDTCEDFENELERLGTAATNRMRSILDRLDKIGATVKILERKVDAVTQREAGEAGVEEHRVPAAKPVNGANGHEPVSG